MIFLFEKEHRLLRRYAHAREMSFSVGCVQIPCPTDTALAGGHGLTIFSEESNFRTDRVEALSGMFFNRITTDADICRKT